LQRHGKARPFGQMMNLILSLTPKARAALYHEVAQESGIANYATPFMFRARTVEDWFLGSGLNRAMVEAGKKAIYLHGEIFVSVI